MSVVTEGETPNVVRPLFHAAALAKFRSTQFYSLLSFGQLWQFFWLSGCVLKDSSIDEARVCAPTTTLMARYVVLKLKFSRLEVHFIDHVTASEGHRLKGLGIGPQLYSIKALDHHDDRFQPRFSIRASALDDIFPTFRETLLKNSFSCRSMRRIAQRREVLNRIAVDQLAASTLSVTSAPAIGMLIATSMGIAR